MTDTEYIANIEAELNRLRLQLQRKQNALDRIQAVPQRVRVIRVLEYDYPDQETAEADMENWGVPPNGVFRIPKGRTHADLVIRSAITFPRTMPHQDPETDSRDSTPGGANDDRS